MTIKYGVREIEKLIGKLTFARLLKSHRLGEGLSQVEMARVLGISKQSLNDLEKERTIPSISRAVEIAKLIGLSKALLVELAIQDQIRREKLNFIVSIKEVKKKVS